MKVRRVSKVLLHSHPTNLISAVSRPNQQQCSRILFNRRSDDSIHMSESSRRTFSTSTSRSQQNASKDDDPPSQQSAQQDSSPSSQPQDQQPLNIPSLLKLINPVSQSGSDTEKTRRPLGGSGGQQQPSLFGSDASKQSSWATNSLDDAAATRAAGQANSQQSAMRLLLRGTVLDRRSSGNIQSKLAWHFPPSEGMVQTAQQKALMEPPDTTSLKRLGPSYGRAVPVEHGDLVNALRKMDIRVNTNGIRKAYHAQKYHERPGLKRKRLASQRWRNRFMQGFRATVQTVQHLRRQGW